MMLIQGNASLKHEARYLRASIEVFLSAGVV
jgi:hypothetical protein